MQKLIKITGFILPMMLALFSANAYAGAAVVPLYHDSIPGQGFRFRIVALPLVYYTPDTEWGVGAGGVTTFNFPKDSTGAKRSSVTIGIAYTQKQQLLMHFPFQLFVKNEQYRISGEVGYYRYVYNFFGIGNDNDPAYVEKYHAVYPRVRLNIYKQVRPGLFAGIRYAFDNFNYTERDPGGMLIKNEITGSDGGLVSGFGFGVNYDTRDIQFYPSSGWFGEAAIYGEHRATGSDFEYQRVSLDVTRYLSCGKGNIIAVNTAAVFSFGNPPFHQMPHIGGPKRLRGYFDGKYRDNHMLLLQAEFRRHIYGRFGVAVFGGSGLVSSDFRSFQIRNTRFNYGAGLRFFVDKTQKINIRADYGMGFRTSGFYLTFGEAF